MKKMPLASSVFATALLGAASVSVQAAQNPFAVQELSSGYSLAAAEKAKEGSCGESKCGGSSKPAATKDGKASHEGSCGAEAKGKEGSCGEAKASKAGHEGTCGGDMKGKEGTCGADKKKS
ncbi:hypothetical protein SAMN05660489_06344 [Pseudomonas sp. LAMO17WK12:I10]|uniref:hypothetical protein n=1 Tax=unclassified Pseudomonas TaxID=196821 RepID=UPI000BD5B976|nr:MULTISPECIES: hypothetical protein [unclassified Pseudomonas]PXX50940.1 hypothetical protein H160_06357 [Pseudomonas sp. LAMO17WK12:I9]SNY53966.1 hypothetical protein SAMN05660489_06344 [Pseudomonas sp. LAMO17WK12:I10]